MTKCFPFLSHFKKGIHGREATMKIGTPIKLHLKFELCDRSQKNQHTNNPKVASRGSSARGLSGWTFFRLGRSLCMINSGKHVSDLAVASFRHQLKPIQMQIGPK